MAESKVATDCTDPLRLARLAEAKRGWGAGVWLKKGEFIVMPRGVEHRPVAEKEAHILLFEPSSTLNTGNIRNQRTVEKPERI